MDSYICKIADLAYYENLLIKSDTYIRGGK